MENLTEDGEDDPEEKRERNWIENDPVRSQQFNYNNSTCFANDHPEINIHENAVEEGVSIAPGEGKKVGSLQEKDLDLKAFPGLHPEGKFGEDAIREVRLTLVNYIHARLFHKDGHFANNNDWLYYMMNLYEEQQIQRNISFSFTRGFEQQSPDGSHVFTLNDPMMALDRMKGTPKYMQHCRNEFYAKLDNLGQFMIFFTLSCADRR